MCMRKKRGRRQESLAGHPVVTQGKAVVDAEKNITTRKRKNQERKNANRIKKKRKKERKLYTNSTKLVMD